MNNIDKKEIRNEVLRIAKALIDRRRPWIEGPVNKMCEHLNEIDANRKAVNYCYKTVKALF